MLKAPEIVAPVLAILVLFSGSTSADSTTAGSNVVQASVLLVPVLVALELPAPVLPATNTRAKNVVNRAFLMLFFGVKKMVGANFTHFCNYHTSRASD